MFRIYSGNIGNVRKSWDILIGSQTSRNDPLTVVRKFSVKAMVNEKVELLTISDSNSVLGKEADV